MSDLIGEVDIAFCIDTTGSMSMYIEEARRHALSEAKRIASSGDLDIRLGLVVYRDHPPQDKVPFISYGFLDERGFTAALAMQMAEGGGDEPESVWDGIKAAADLPWRETAEHMLFLIGDSPPHGVGCVGDGFPDGCPCGLTGAGLTEVLSMKRIRLYAHSIAGNKLTTQEFKRLAEASGGNCTEVERPEFSTDAYTRTMITTSGLISSSRTYSMNYASAMSANPYAGDAVWNAVASAKSGLTSDVGSGVQTYMRGRKLWEHDSKGEKVEGSGKIDDLKPVSGGPDPTDANAYAPNETTKDLW